jgi:hypothetical protein
MSIEDREALPDPGDVRARDWSTLECWNSLAGVRDPQKVLDLRAPFEGPGKHLS